MSIVHVLPVTDFIRHEPGEGCICIPSTEYVIGSEGESGKVFTHHELTREPVPWAVVR